jgi:HEAT repeat protein
MMGLPEITDEQALAIVELALNKVDLMLGARLAGAVKSALQEQTLNVLSSLAIPKLLKIRLLAHTQSNSAISFLNAFWGDRDSDVRDAIMKALGQIGSQEAVNRLLEALESENTSVYGLATYWLGKIGSGSAVEALLKALKHNNSYFRQRAAEALGEIRNEDVVAALCEVLNDDDEKVRFYASFSLIKIGNQIELSPRCQYLVDKVLYRYQNLQNIDSELSELPPDTNQIAEQIDDEEKKLLLEKLMHENLPAHRLVNLAGQLLKLNDEDVLSSLQKFLKHKNFSVRFAVSLVLTEINLEDTTPILLQGLGSEDTFFYTSSSVLLKKVGTPNLISKIYSLLLDRSTIRPLYLRHLLGTILAIQNRYQVYNYTIATQSDPLPPVQPFISQNSANVIMNFYKDVYGAAGTVQGNQIINPPTQNSPGDLPT